MPAAERLIWPTARVRSSTRSISWLTSGPTPQAYAWIAAGRLWMAGLGMFLLARSWGLGSWGRWFAGLAYPFCGFLVLWLLFPVTAVAIWMPWLFLATDRVFRTPGRRAAGWLAVVVALVIFGGHIQTSRSRADRRWALHAGQGLLGASRRSPVAASPHLRGRWEPAWAWGCRPSRSCRWVSIWPRARSGATARANGRLGG